MNSAAAMIQASIVMTLALLAASGAAAQVPDTPAGRQFTAWLDAMNSSDRASMQTFMDKSMPGQSVEQGLAIRAQAGGYDVKQVELDWERIERS